MWKHIGRVVNWIFFGVSAVMVLFLCIAMYSDMTRHETNIGDIIGIVLFFILFMCLDFVICSILGAVVETAFNVKKIAQNTDEIKYLIQTSCGHSPVQTVPIQTAPVQTAPIQTAPIQTAPTQASTPVQNNNEWICNKCTTINSTDHCFCYVCGAPKS